eukprot:Gb_33673 [translate_table: standard]
MTCGEEQNLDLEAGDKESKKKLEDSGMEGEDADEDARGGCQFRNVRKTFWRSASWSSSRSAPPSPGTFPHGKAQPPFGLPTDMSNVSNRGPVVPLTPRLQQISKARSSLPPLQPLSITPRSLEEWPKAGSDDIGEWLTPATPREKRDVGNVRNGADMRLDLCSVQRNAEPTEIQLKRDKFAFYDRECSRVADHIYLGSDAVARNREILEGKGITHVLNCVGFVCPEYFKKDLVYKTLWLQDTPCEDITSILYDVFDYFEEVREQGGRVLVHCYQGVSRSTSLVIAYLMWRKGQSFEDAFQYVKAARGITNPNMGFACQLLQCQKRVHAAPMSPSSILRMYRMAPHSPYDPLHLVPKILNNPMPAALDSRGAFIVHVPSAIYVWIGQSCESAMATAAKASAFQVVRYERAQGPIVTVLEGEDNPEFWDALSKAPPYLDEPEKSTIQADDISKAHCSGKAFMLGVGNKRVESYDVDFELFRRAAVGGVVPPVPSSGSGSETHLPTRENGWGILRRKFVAGNMKELASVASKTFLKADVQKEMESANEDIQQSMIEPKTSSSSPHMSPSSLSSDSKCSSKSPSPSPSSLPFTPSSSSSASWSPSSSCHSQSPVVDSMETFERSMCPSQVIAKSASSLSKVSPVSLAQRRGSVSPSLQLPVLGNDYFLVSRGALKGSQHSPAVVRDKGTIGNESSRDSCTQYDLLGLACSAPYCACQHQSPDHNKTVENKDVHFGKQNEDRKQSCSSILAASIYTTANWEGNTSDPSQATDGTSTEVDESPSVSRPKEKITCKWTHPVLYDWPKLEHVDMFDVDDLDSRAIFVLLVPSQGAEDAGYVYVWVGCDSIVDEESNQANSSKDRFERREVDWEQIGRNFLERMDLQKHTFIRIGHRPFYSVISFSRRDLNRSFIRVLSMELIKDLK